MLTLGELKTYLRIDGGEDDQILALLVEAAKGYLTDAGIVKMDSLPDDADPEEKERVQQYIARYNLAVMLYVALHYENRDPAQKMDRFSFALESIILQLKTSV